MSKIQVNLFGGYLIRSLDDMQKRNRRLLSSKLNKYIVPGIMMSLALQLGNIVDTIFVSNFIGVDAMSAITASLPVETIIQLVGYCLGIGG